MVALVTLDAAKQHLRVTFEDDDEDIERKVEQASEIVLDYIKRRGPQPDPDQPVPPDDWDDDTVPPPVAAAVLLLLSQLYDDRDPGKVDGNVALGYLTPTITALLHRYRDPALA